MGDKETGREGALTEEGRERGGQDRDPEQTLSWAGLDLGHHARSEKQSSQRQVGAGPLLD